MDDAELAAALESLASPTRLDLLRALRSPKILAEIVVQPAGRDGYGALARQTVRRHLDSLLEAGVVQARDVVREGRETTEFVVNHQAVYGLAEELRDLARLRPDVEPAGGTMPGVGPVAGDAERGPSLVLVKGLDEGRSFDLSPRVGAPAEWLVGRRRGLAVSLDFDPFVSAENTRIWREGDAHLVESLPASRNGTTLNFRPLRPGERRRLGHGDLLGVGRSILSYRA